MTHKLTGLSMLALAGILSTSLAVPQRANAAEAAETLVYCAEAAPRSLDPSAYFDGATLATVAFPMFDRLVDYVPGTTDIVPALATSWSVSDDGRVYRFKLRPGVRFHATDWFTPSREMNADDVVFSFGRQLDETHPWHGVNDAGAYGPISDMGEFIERIEADGDDTVVFYLSEPYAPFVSNLAMGVASIVSAEYAAAIDEDGDRTRFAREPIGTGPFRFEGYTQDVALRFSANDAYWAGAPKSQNLVTAIVIDQAVRTQKVETGECHIAPYPAPAEIDRLERLETVRVSEIAGLNFAYLAFNTLQPPFDDPEVRRAVAMAIDKETIVEAVYSGRAEPADIPVPPGLWGRAGDLDGPGYDPDAARAIIEEKGLAGTALKLWAMPVQRDYNPNGKRMAEIIAADLEDIGFEPEIISYEWAEYLKRSKDRDRDGAVLLGWIADAIDPDNFLTPMFVCRNVGGSNRANWCNEEYDRLIDRASKVADREERTRLYRQAQEIWLAAMPQVPIAYARFADIMRSGVQGFVQEPMGWHRFHDAYVEADQ